MALEQLSEARAERDAALRERLVSESRLQELRTDLEALTRERGELDVEVRQNEWGVWKKWG